MEIINERFGEKPFQEIVWGECFLSSNGDVYMRVKGQDTAVRLSDGEPCDFGEDYLVNPVVARVVIA